MAVSFLQLAPLALNVNGGGAIASSVRKEPVACSCKQRVDRNKQIVDRNEQVVDRNEQLIDRNTTSHKEILVYRNALNVDGGKSRHRVDHTRNQSRSGRQQEAHGFDSEVFVPRCAER